MRSATITIVTCLLAGCQTAPSKPQVTQAELLTVLPHAQAYCLPRSTTQAQLDQCFRDYGYAYGYAKGMAHNRQMAAQQEAWGKVAAFGFGMAAGASRPPPRSVHCTHVTTMTTVCQ
ncbi:hypothetical protein [Mongoliimonas terrestris]|uniref:hypothetical protein n=1 Tax=Mongoliimonas terrestris TaxID=1709001 RepID=UPI000949AD68|nr:hypothetical protein [Mongoliimonas terrestris]